MVAQALSNTRMRIFISYGHDEHVDMALRLKEDLIAHGHEVWFDIDRLKPGTEWEHYIEEGLSWASEDGNGRIILIMTPHSVRRPDGFCLNEMAMALMKNLKILPIMLVWCEPPLSICRIQWLDMQDCLPLEGRQEKYSVKFQELIEALEQGLPEYEGYQTSIFNVLKPLSFDAEIRYKQDKFTGRSWFFEEIDRWLSDENSSRVFWIVGGPGVGKTAISSWLCAHRPEIAALHFCRYDDVQKRDPRRAVMSIAYQLSTQLPDYEERLRRVSMGDLAGLDARTLFDQLIVQPFNANYPSPGRDIVILIDALDEATADGKNDLASLISSSFERTPHWLRLIITSRPSPEVTAPLKAYCPLKIDMADPRNNDDIKAYLSQQLCQVKMNARPLDIELIVKKSGGLFLYAEWIVNEIKQGRLSLDRPDMFPQGLAGIYLKLFERQFPDLPEWECNIAPALEVVAVAQEPLSLEIVASIFNWDGRNKRKFRQELGPLFSFDNGIQPFHKSIMDWLTDEAKEDHYYIDINIGNRLLAEHLWQEYQNNAWSHYLVCYLPQHLFNAQRWKELEALLLDMKFIRAAWEADRMRVLTQLVAIDESSPLKMATIYGNSFFLEGNDEKGLYAIADLLIESMHFEDGEHIMNYIIPRYRQSNDLISLSQALDRMSYCSSSRYNFEETKAYIQELEDISRKINDKKVLLNALNQKCWMYDRLCEPDQQYKVAIELERVSREIGNDWGLARSFWYQAGPTIGRCEWEQALLLLGEEEQIDRALGYIDNLASNLNSQGWIYFRKGDYKSAMPKLEETIAIGLQTGNKFIISAALETEGRILEAMGQLDSALSKYEEGAKVVAEVKDKSTVSFNLASKGRVLLKKNRVDEAETLIRKSLSMAMEIGYPDSIQYSLGVLAMVLTAKGDRSGAMEALDRQEKICHKTGFQFELQECLELRKMLGIDFST